MASKAPTKPSTGENPAPAAEQAIEQLQQRYEQLNKQKIQAETKHDSANATLKALKQEARDKYGTDDIDELKRKLAAIKAENEQKRSQYQADLDKIESDLAAVEQRFAAVESGPAKGTS
jgi:chromosome segregation ATPase